jgi:glycosyltransferase involved in cell wall biosynthesis
MNDIGVVIIGRNEGERLKTCITSLSREVVKLVYVDSGSTDGSVDFVIDGGFDVVELDTSVPFSAARARNEGYHHLLSKYEDIEFVQFIDGDCEMYTDWLACARQRLIDNPRLASVCGRRKERYPSLTIYNQLCDIEWNTPVGLTKATGGDFMCRAKAFSGVGGFCSSVIAGEEPELGFRLRQKGWLIERIDMDMTKHDANMTSIRQWFKRNERSGHAYAQGACMHGASEEKYYVKDSLRIMLWGLLLPLICLLSAPFYSVLCLIILSLYPLKVAQMFFGFYSNWGFRTAFIHASLLMLGKFPQAKGMLTFFWKQLSGKNYRIIEYKD